MVGMVIRKRKRKRKRERVRVRERKWFPCWKKNGWVLRWELMLGYGGNGSTKRQRICLNCFWFQKLKKRLLWSLLSYFFSAHVNALLSFSFTIFPLACSLFFIHTPTHYISLLSVFYFIHFYSAQLQEPCNHLA